MHIATPVFLALLSTIGVSAAIAVAATNNIITVIILIVPAHPCTSSTTSSPSPLSASPSYCPRSCQRHGGRGAALNR
eukprot:8903261-Pyramimonas_sp.AAC.1